MTAEQSSPAFAMPDDALRAEGDRIEHLLDEIRGVAGPETWPRVDELVQRLVGLYGEGLGRLLAHAQATGDVDALRRRVGDDELLSSLLLLHGMHPDPPEERVRRAVEAMRPALREHAVEVVSLEDDALRLRVIAACDGCGASHAAVEQYVRGAIAEIAPELNGVQIDGLSAERPRSSLVQLHVPARTGGAS